MGCIFIDVRSNPEKLNSILSFFLFLLIIHNFVLNLLLFFSGSSCSKTVVCERWQFSCEDGQHCVHYSSLCDGTPNCEDYSDEHPKMCQIIASKKSAWPCLSGEKFVQKHQFCDGKVF